MRVIIAAAGAQPKWGHHLGVPKQLVPVPEDGGRPLLARTITQARRHSTDVHVTVPAGGGVRWALAGAVRHERDGGEASEYAATRNLWNPAGRTVLLLGDVYFTDPAIDLILSQPNPDYRCFGRYGPSAVTGTPYGEIFAASWWPNQHHRLDAALAQVHALRAAGTITRPPGWMLLRGMQGTPMGRHRVAAPWFVDVTTVLPGDCTDDIDVPADHDRHPAFRGGAGWAT